MLGSYDAYLQYEQNPDVQKPIEEIYADLDSCSREDDKNDPNIEPFLFAYVLVPPVYYEGTWVKGVISGRAIDYFAEQYPRIKEAFFLVASSFCCAFPFSTTADAYLTLFNNQHRIQSFKQRVPERSNRLFLPFHDADYFHEYLVAPQQVEQPKEHDIVVISRLESCKNLWIVAEALKTYHHKYGRKLSCVLILGADFDINKDKLSDQEKDEYRKIEKVLPHVSDYITIVPKLTDYSKTMEYLAKARVCVLGSLLEGKNRSIYEAMGCNTPAVCFQDYVKYARGDQPIFPDGCGLTAPDFSGESLADTIHTVINNQAEFKPRQRILEVAGRKNTTRMCLQGIPYFSEHIPDFSSVDIFSNLWYDLAIQSNYQLSLVDFIYDKNRDLSMPRAGRVKDIFNFYLSRLEYFEKYSR